MLERIFWFFRQLKKNRFPSRSRYLERWEVSGSTFKRDITFLRDRLGAPLSYSRSGNGYYLTDTAFEIPSFWFNHVHLFMMIGICNQLSFLTGKAPEEIAMLKSKIEHLLTLQDGERVLDLVSFENVEGYRFENHCFGTLLETIMEKRCVRITYHTAHSDEIGDRTVEPYRLHNYMGSWHMVGFCRYRGEPRVFLLGRIHNIEPLNDRFKRRKFDVIAFLDDSFGIYKGDGILTEIRMKVLKYGSHVEVLEPEELRAQVLEEAKRIVDIYEK